MRIFQTDWESVESERVESMEPGLGAIIRVTDGRDIVADGYWVDLGDPATAHYATGRNEFRFGPGNPDDVCLGGKADQYGTPGNNAIRYVSCTLMDLQELGWDVSGPAITYHQDPGNDFSLPFDPVADRDSLWQWMERTGVEVDLLDGHIATRHTMYKYGSGVSLEHARRLIMDHDPVGDWITLHAPARADR